MKTGSGAQLVQRPCAHWQGVALALSELGAGRALSRKGRGSAAPLQDRVAAEGGWGTEASKAAGGRQGTRQSPGWGGGYRAGAGWEEWERSFRLLLKMDSWRCLVDGTRG